MIEAAAPQPTTAPQPTSPTDLTPDKSARLTPSMLFYAFADQVAPPAGRLDTARPVPCAGPQVRVKQEVLATTLVQAAFWDLERRGRIRIEVAEHKVLFVRTRTRVVRVVDGATPEAEVEHSLEYDLLKEAIRLHGDGEVRSVVRALYPGDVEDPFGRVLAMANVAEIRAGLARLDVEERSGLGKVLGKKERLVWLCDRVAAHRDEFGEVVGAWKQDHDASKDAFEERSTDIRRAIYSRKAAERESLLETLAD